MSQTAALAKAATLSYDRDENIVYVSFASAVELNTQEEIAAHFEHVISFWRAHALGKKSYFVVDFSHVTINMAEIEFYAQQTDQAHELCAITSVRYGGNALQRTITRLAGMKIHRPSNIYATRAQAVAVVQNLKSGKMAPKVAKK